MESLVKIGTIIKAHGVKGIIKVRVSPEIIDDIIELEAIFVGDNEQKAFPYFVQKAEAISDNEILLQLEDTDSKEKAVAMVKKSIWARASEIELPEEEDDINDLVGYLLIDKSAGTIGIIEEIQEMPQQYLAKITWNEKEVLIPLHGDLIESIDDDKREIITDLPEGFFEIF